MPKIRAMASIAAAFPRTPSPTAALIGIYARATLWYLALVAACWIIGIEGIHGHPLPFYALLFPAADSISSTSGFVLYVAWNALALALLGALWFAIKRFYLVHIQDADADSLTRWHVAGLVLFAAAFPVAVAMIRGGPEALAHAYSRQAYEYVGDIGSGGSIRGLFHDYAKIHPYLSMHAKVHPPGPIAILWLLSYIAGRTPTGLSIATILFGAGSVVPMYYWAVDVLGKRRGLIATLLYTLVPTIVLFTATSADITFMPFTLATLFLFWRAIHRSSPARASLYALGAGAFYGALGLISFSLLSLGAFFALVGLWRLADPRYRWAVVRTAAIMFSAAVAVHLLVYLWSGYDSIAVFQIAKNQFDTDQANLDVMDPRFAVPWWKILNPLCWFFFAGVPVSMLFLGRFRSARSRRNALVWICGLSLVAFDILYLARGEGERSAMYIMPFLVLPAAERLDELVSEAGSWGPLAATLAFLGLQSIAMENVLYTYW